MRKFSIIGISLVITLLLTGSWQHLVVLNVSAAAPVVNPDVLASPASDPDPHDEPFVAVSPVNNQIIVAISKVIVGGAASQTEGVSRVAYYFSSNGGRTWGSGLIPLQTPQKTFDFSSDPTVAVDTNGIFYLCVLMGSSSLSGTNDGGVYAYKSIDNGQTFGQIIPVAFDIGSSPQNAKIYDKPALLVDTVPTSPFKNTVYVTWVGNNYPPVDPVEPTGGTRIAHMRPGDSAFSTEQLISHPGNMEGPQLAIGPNGEVYGTWEGIGAPKTLLLDASTDGGVTFGSDVGEPGQVTAHDARLRAFVGSLSEPSPGTTVPGISRMNTWPTIAVDCSNGPHRGTIYVAWAESLNQVNSNIYLFALPPPNGSLPQPPPPTAVGPSGADQFFPQLSVDQQTGTVYIAFCDQAGGGSSFNTYITSSSDGGTTFAPNIRVSSQFSNPQVQSNIIGANESGIGIGDYIGLTFVNGSAHLVWTDTRDAKQEIFYGRVDFGPTGTTGGGGPPNDNCFTPTSITSLPFTDSIDTTNATSFAADPVNCSGSAGSNSVWYSLTATAGTVYGVDTSGSSYDTVLAVYTGTCGSFTQIACSDDFGNNLGQQSMLTFQAQAGTKYMIEVTGKGTGGNLHVRVGFPTVTSISFGAGPDGKSLKLSGAGFVVNNAQATVTVGGVDTILPTSSFTGTTLPDGTTTSMFATKPKLKKLIKPGVPVTVRVESPVGSGNTSVPLSFTR